jgi:hypothetical protein
MGIGNFKIIDRRRANFNGNLLDWQIIAVRNQQQMAGTKVFGLDPAETNHPERTLTGFVVQFSVLKRDIKWTFLS